MELLGATPVHRDIVQAEVGHGGLQPLRAAEHGLDEVQVEVGAGDGHGHPGQARPRSHVHDAGVT